MSIKNQEINNNLLRFSWISLVVIGALTFVEGLLQVTGIITGRTDFIEIYTGVDWNQFATGNPEMAEYINNMGLQFGILFISISLFGSVIAWKSYKNGESWAWYTMWLFPITFGFFSITMLISTNDMLFSGLLSGIFSIISAIVILLPYKVFFS